MESIKTIFYEEPELKDPILIEGLPGVGNVGKLAADHLLDQIDAVKLADVYSKHFPEGERPDLLMLLGDYQALTPEGQYELSDHVLKVAMKYGAKMIFTLGGYGVGKMVDEPRVLGAATDMELIEQMKEKGVTFSKGEPGSGIVGASGLLLGLGKVYGIKAICLMGETSGYFVDPKGAEAVLRVLADILKVEIDFSDLKDKAEQIDMITSKLKEIETPQEPKREDLGYIG